MSFTLRVATCWTATTPLRGFAALLADERLGHVWFIQADSKDVGHVVVSLCFSMEYGGLIAFVDDLFIQPPYRRTGLGTAALVECGTFA